MFADCCGGVFTISRVFILALGLFSFTGCTTIESKRAEARLTQQNTLAVLWFQHAAECRALLVAIREVRDRHHLDMRYPQRHQVIQSLDRTVECARRSEGADVQLVDDRRLP